MDFEKDFKVIQDFPNYEVSKNGDIRNIQTKKILKPEIKNRFGHSRVHLYKNGIAKRFQVHRIVAQAFIPNPENKPQVNHLDSNPRNNHFSNLEWATSKENNIHAVYIGNNDILGSKHHNSKLTENEVLELRQALKNNVSAKECSEKYGISLSVVYKIKNRDIWNHI